MLKVKIDFLICISVDTLSFCWEQIFSLFLTLQKELPKNVYYQPNPRSVTDSIGHKIQEINSTLSLSSYFIIKISLRHNE